MNRLIGLARLISGLVGLFALGLCGLALGAPFHWILALFGAWDRLIIASGLIGLGAFWVARWRVLAGLQLLALIALLGLNFRVPTDYSPFYDPSPHPGEELILAWANIHDNRFALNKLAQVPDVTRAYAIGLGEVPAFSDLRHLFPNVGDPNYVTSSQRTWGVETLGCKIIAQNDDLTVRPGRHFGLKARCPGFTLFVLHLQNPTRGRGEGLRLRNLELAALARAVAQAPGPVLVMGDFNTTPSAVPFYVLLKTANLKRVSCGPPFAGTWRPIDWSGKPLDRVPGLKVTIDHILVRDLDVRRCNIGPDVGSDHFPLIVTLAKPR